MAFKLSFRFGSQSKFILIEAFDVAEQQAKQEKEEKRSQKETQQ